MHSLAALAGRVANEEAQHRQLLTKRFFDDQTKKRLGLCLRGLLVSNKDLKLTSKLSSPAVAVIVPCIASIFLHISILRTCW